jgi:hypothetical protein
MPIDHERKRQQRRFIAFSWVAAIVVLLLAALDLRGGADRTLGVAIGLPIIAIQLLITFRWGRAIKRS